MSMSIKEWYYMQRNKKKYLEDGEALGGEEAELYVKNTVETCFFFKNAYCFIGKRVPYKTASKSGRKEIDLIVVTPKMIHIIEVKNWSGVISGALDQDTWQQTRRNGEVVPQKNPLKTNQEKMYILRDYLEKNKCHFPENPSRYFSQKVIFMNEKGVLDRAIRSNLNVILARELHGYVANMETDVLVSRIFKSIIEKCLDSELAVQVCDGLLDSLTPQAYQRIIDLVSQLGTWDYLKLYGGKRIKGDLLHICFFDGKTEQKIKRDELSDKVVSFSWHRGHLWLLTQFFFPIGSFCTKTSRYALDLSLDTKQKPQPYSHAFFSRGKRK